ncbi:hypothetical protein Tco_1511794 [Tanacetum coccineum]
MGFEAPCVDFLILQSCNGLLLLGCEHDYDYPFKFYICSPFLNLFKMLPQCDDLKLSESFNVTGMILAFDPTRSPHYKVIKTVVEHVYNGGVLFVHIIITLQKQTIGVFVVYRHFNIYQMINENAGWSLKYIVNLHDTMEPFPKPRGIGSCVWFVVLGEREEDSFMVMELRNKVVQYKIVLKTVRELCESKWKSTRFQFIASFAGV